MRSPLASILALALAAVAASAAGQEWRTVWQDEFRGEGAPDPARWRIAEGRARIEGGTMVLDLPSSGTVRVQAAENLEVGYGRVALRARIPRGEGIRAAAILRPVDDEAAPAVIELFRSDAGTVTAGLVFGTADDPYAQRQDFEPAREGTPDELELFWSEGLMRWQLNGSKVLEASQWYGGDALYPAPFNGPARLEFSLRADRPARFQIGSVTVEEPAAPPPRGPWALPLPTIPGTIEAEEFDRGGQGVGSLDCTEANEGGALRPDERVDIEPCNDIGGGWHVAYILPGEWLEYTVRVRRTAVYRVYARVSSLDAGGALEVRLRDAPRRQGTGPAFFPPTGSWTRWNSIPVGTIRLEEGEQVLRVSLLRAFFNLNRLELRPVEEPQGRPKAWMLY